MRKILIFLLVCLFSCENHFELEPKMYIRADEAFGNRENVYAAMTGCYDALQLQHYYGRNLVIIGDLASDNSKATGTKIEYYSTDDNSLLADNILVEGIWNDIYTAINRVNYVLYMLDEVDFLSPEEKTEMTAQLSFLRALHYFNLVRLYGGVPKKVLPTMDDTEDNYLPRSSVSEIYELILQDLQKAISGIANQNPDRATKQGAGFLLSLVNLTLGKYEESLSVATQVYDSCNFLEPDPAELYISKNEPSPEILFYIPFAASDKNRLAEYHLPNPLGGRYENSPTLKLISRIEEKDRRAKLIASSYGDKFYTTKYSDLTTGTDPVIVFRAAELLFIMAEAEYKLDSIGNCENIRSHLNTLRERAGLNPIDTLKPGTIWNNLERERQLEFAFEGKRWFDLIRTNTATGSVGTVTSPNQMLFPIPLSEIAANPKISISDQNEGY